MVIVDYYSRWPSRSTEWFRLAHGPDLVAAHVHAAIFAEGHAFPLQERALCVLQRGRAFPDPQIAVCPHDPLPGHVGFGRDRHRPADRSGGAADLAGDLPVGHYVS